MGGTGNVRIDSTLIPTNPVLVVNNSGSYFRQTLNFAAGQYSFMTFSLAIANELYDLTNVGDTNGAGIYFRNASGYQVGGLVFPFAAPSAATRQWQVYTVSGAVPPTATYLQLDINKAVYDVANPKNVFYVDNLVAIGTCTGSPMNATKPGTLPYNLDCAANPGPSCPPLCDACTNNIIQNGALTDGVTSNFMVWPQGSTDVRIDNTLVPGNSILVVNGTGSYFRVTQNFNAGQYTTMTFSLSVANELNDCSNVQDTASAVIYFRDATNFQVGGLVFPFQAQTVASSRYWKVYTVSGPVPATATYFQLDINKAVYNLANPKNTFYVDNLVAIGNCASTTVNSTNPAILPYNLDCTTIAGPSCPVVCDACQTNLIQNGAFTNGATSNFVFYPQGTTDVRIDNTLISGNPVLVVNGTGSYFRATLNFSPGQYTTMSFSLSIANELNDCSNVQDTNSAVVFFRNATGFQVGAFVFPFAAPSIATREWQVYTVAGPVPATATYFQLDINKAVYNLANPKNKFYIDNLIAVGNCASTTLNATKPTGLPYNLNCGAQPGNSCPDMCSVTPPPTPPTPAPTPVPTTSGPTTAGPTTAAPTPSQNGSGGNIITDSANVNMVSKMLIFVCAVFVVCLFA